MITKLAYVDGRGNQKLWEGIKGQNCISPQKRIGRQWVLDMYFTVLDRSNLVYVRF